MKNINDIENNLISEIELLEKSIKIKENSKLHTGIILVALDGTTTHVKFDQDTVPLLKKLKEAKNRLAIFRAE